MRVGQTEPVQVDTTIIIERPATEVFDFIADMSNNPEWQRGQQSCVWTTEPPIRVGSTYDQVAKFLGREIRSSFEVVEYEPDLIRITSTAGTMPIDVTRTVAPEGSDRCSVSAVVRGEPPAAMRLLGPVLGSLVRRSVAGDYRRLKKLLEAAN